jgi:hypothetical protein
MTSLLEQMVGKKVTVHLVTGEKCVGILASVTPEAFVLSELKDGIDWPMVVLRPAVTFIRQYDSPWPEMDIVACFRKAEERKAAKESAEKAKEGNPNV